MDDIDAARLDIELVIKILANRFGHEPTEDDIFNFIFGSDADRFRIWNNKEVR